MGIDVRIEDEEARPIGEAVLDVNNHLRDALLEASSGSLIRYIDACGDTLFNQLQIPVVISELEALLGQAKPEYRFQLSRTVGLLREATGKSHVYARFVGD
jgi:hypothetical protein